MKVLLIHNRYRKYSGEEAMVESTGRVLRENGCEVEWFYRDSSSIHGRLAALRAVATSFRAAETLSAVKKTVARFRPDIVQIQNIYPLISAHVFRTVFKMGVPVVFRCPNYRLFCPTGLMLRDGRPCERCATSTHLNCIRFNCEGSILKSVVYGLRNEYARILNLVTPYVAAFLVPSEFQKAKFHSWGIPSERIHVIPNLLPKRFRAAIPRSPFGNYVGYAGRISSEKGIDLIINVATRHSEIPFKLAGHGEEEYLRKLRLPPNMEYVGMLEDEALAEFYRNARFFVIPSQWYETFGLVAIEAMRNHKPVLASRIGALQETVLDGQNGLLFQPNCPEDFEHKLLELWNNASLTKAMQDTAADTLDARFGDTPYYRRLSTVYASVLARGCF